MLPTPEIDEQQLNARVEAAVSIDFEGPFSGNLLVRICGGLLPILAANMLGEEEVPSKSLQYDALERSPTSSAATCFLPLQDRKMSFM